MCDCMIKSAMLMSLGVRRSILRFEHRVTLVGGLGNLQLKEREKFHICNGAEELIIRRQASRGLGFKGGNTQGFIGKLQRQALSFRRAFAAAAAAAAAMESTRWWSPQTVAVVTGGNKGIGHEIVRQLATQGITVVIGARDKERGLAAAQGFHSKGLTNVEFHQLDITDPESVTAFADWIQKTYGGLDILVNNAAVLHWSNKYQEAEEDINVNYKATIHVTETLLPFLKPSSAGARIIIMSSFLGQLEHFKNHALREQLMNPDHYTQETLDEFVEEYLEACLGRHTDKDGYPVAYCVSKAVINAYTRLLAKRVANRPEGHKIYVNSVHPGSVKTDMNKMGVLTTKEGADTAVWLSLLPPECPSGLFFFERKELSFEG